MAVWHMFLMLDKFTATFHNVAKDITSVSWPTSRTKGYQFTTRTIPPSDSITLANKLRARNAARRNKPRGSIPDRKRIEKSGKIITLPSTIQRTQYRPDFRHYLQHVGLRKHLERSNKNWRIPKGLGTGCNSRYNILHSSLRTLRAYWDPT